MLLAHEALQRSQNRFLSLEEELTKKQQEKPHEILWNLLIPHPDDKQELIDIAVHFASLGYDVSCVCNVSFSVDCFFAEEGRTGKIDIRNSYCNFQKDAT